MYGLLAALSLLLASPALATPHPHSMHYFPGWSTQIRDGIQANCSQELSDYFANTRTQDYANAVVDCVITNSFSPTRQLTQGASTLVLGLMPTILQDLGPSPAETSVLALRRPFLALFVAAGSPMVNTIKSASYTDPVLDLKKPVTLSVRQGYLEHPGSMGIALISAFEYILVLAAAVNVAFAAYQLSTWSVIVYFAYDFAMAPVWTYTALIVHMLAIWALNLRTEIIPRLPTSKPDRNNGQPARYHPVTGSTPGPDQCPSLSASMWHFLQREFTPSAYRDGLNLRILLDSYMFQAASWALRILTVGHLVLGTLVLSGQIFIDLGDAAILIVRYAIGAIFCKLVLVYVLQGLKEATQDAVGKDGTDAVELMPVKLDTNTPGP